MKIEDRKMIANAVKLGQCRKEIAKRFNVSQSSISRFCDEFGVTRPRRFNEEKKREIVKYRQEHTSSETCKKYGIQSNKLVELCEKYAGKNPESAEITHRVRVLNRVPENFSAPSRGFGW